MQKPSMRSGSFKHFILTRYALRFQKLLPPEWFKNRVKLFRKTVSSVAEQTNRNFTWLVFYSPVYESYIEELWCDPQCLQLGIRFIPVYGGNFENCDAEMRAAMAALLTDETCVLSTRLDNDDLIAPDFVAIIQAHSDVTLHPYFLNFDEGRNRLEDGTFRPHHHPTNMFQTLVESRRAFKGIFSWAHNSTPKVGQVIHLTHHNRWIHVEHSDMLWPDTGTVVLKQ